MTILSPFGKLYGRIMDVRNLLYDRDLLKSYDLGARTISVGNLTTGGTGKTPLVALIAETLIAEGEKVCILTRGYGREHPRKRVLVADGEKVLADAATGGDEPVELAYKLGGKAVVIADPDRVAAAKWALENFPISTFILDDAFQHRRAKRNLDIVCVDATDPCGHGRVLPAGKLRESFKGLKRADAIVITRTEQIEDASLLESRLRKKNLSAPTFRARTQLKGFVSIEDFTATTQKPESVEVDHCFALTGIANSGNFVETLAKSGLNIVGSESFRDHHRFTQTEIEKVESKAKQVEADALVTTGKDAVKLKGLRFSLPCYVAIAETVIDDSDRFKELIIFS